MPFVVPSQLTNQLLNSFIAVQSLWFLFIVHSIGNALNCIDFVQYSMHTYMYISCSYVHRSQTMEHIAELFYFLMLFCMMQSLKTIVCQWFYINSVWLPCILFRFVTFDESLFKLFFFRSFSEFLFSTFFHNERQHTALLILPHMCIFSISPFAHEIDGLLSCLSSICTTIIEIFPDFNINSLEKWWRMPHTMIW